MFTFENDLTDESIFEALIIIRTTDVNSGFIQDLTVPITIEVFDTVQCELTISDFANWVNLELI